MQRGNVNWRVQSQNTISLPTLPATTLESFHQTRWHNGSLRRLSIQHSPLTISLISWRCKPIPIQTAFTKPLPQLSQSLSFIPMVSHLSDESQAILIFSMRLLNLRCCRLLSRENWEATHRPTGSVRPERSGLNREFKCTAYRNPHINAQDTLVTESRAALFLSAVRPGPRESAEEAKGYVLKVTHAPRQPFLGTLPRAATCSQRSGPTLRQHGLPSAWRTHRLRARGVGLFH